MSATAKKSYQNTTLRVPRDLYELAKIVMRRSHGTSFNEFAVQAIVERVRRLTESEIDAAFAGMAQDSDFQRSTVGMAQEFEKSDWEAFELSGAVPVSRKSSNARTSKARLR